MKLIQSLLFGSVSLAILAPYGAAHFRLIEPASWLQESQLGDPQKMAPCGGTSADAGKPTGAVTNVQGGDKLHIKLRETVFHPGFYRVALAVNSRDELTARPGREDRAHSERPTIGLGVHSIPTGAADSRRWLVPAHYAVRQGSGNRRRHSEYQLLEMYASDRGVHGRPRPEQRWRLQLSPLRRPADPSQSR